MKQLRIIAGKYGGRLISTPGTHATHPMGDRERSAIFNSVQHDLPGVRVLDAFAGSGSIGLEALSRGAAHVTFLEKDHKARKVLTQNVQTLGVQDQTTITKNALAFGGSAQRDPSENLQFSRSRSKSKNNRKARFLDNFNIDYFAQSPAYEKKVEDFAIIFADPPYDHPQYALIEQLLTHLAPGGIFVLSHPAAYPPPTFPRLTLISAKTYAASNIKIYHAHS